MIIPQLKVPEGKRINWLFVSFMIICISGWTIVIIDRVKKRPHFHVTVPANNIEHAVQNAAQEVSTQTASSQAGRQQPPTHHSASPQQTAAPHTHNGRSFVYGIDISRYQGDEIEHLNSTTDTLGFIICKATQGNSYVDLKFRENWANIGRKGFVRGAYHFYMCKNDPIRQADHFVTTINIQPHDLPPIVDFEEGGLLHSQSVSETQQNLKAFLKEVESKTGRKPMIYTDLNTGNGYLNDSDFAAYPLWVANYRKGDNPHLPKTWKGTKWLFWQKSDHYKIGSTMNDFDLFNGTMEDLKDFIKSTTSSGQ